MSLMRRSPTRLAPPGARSSARLRNEIAAQHLAFELADRDLARRQRDLGAGIGDRHAVGKRQGAEADIELALDAVERGKVERMLGPDRLAGSERLGARRLRHLLAVERQAEQPRYRGAIDFDLPGDDGRAFARIGERDAAVDPAAADGQLLRLQLDGVIGGRDLDRADDGRFAAAPRPSRGRQRPWRRSSRAPRRAARHRVRGCRRPAAPRGRRSRRTAPAPWPTPMPSCPWPACRPP